jgi:protein TonB
MVARPAKLQKPAKPDLIADKTEKSTGDATQETKPEPQEKFLLPQSPELSKAELEIPEAKKPEPVTKPVEPRKPLPKKPKSVKPGTEIKPEPEKQKKTFPTRKPLSNPAKTLVKKTAKKPTLATDSAKCNKPPPSNSHVSAKKTPQKAKPDFSPWFKRVFQEIERQKKYPSRARRRNIQGQVLARFRVNKFGKPIDISIKNKPAKQLARAATELLQKIRLPHPPAEWNTEGFIEIPIIYKLR